jgi:MoaA/NifB/PqqE/SkfB family radical SAM enzyme
MLGGSLWNSLRYAWLMARRGPHFGADFLQLTNRRFCNGPDKVIGWSRGYPSYYLLAPPVLSRPAMNSLTTRLMSLYQWRKLPDLISVAVTAECNLRCEFCSYEAMRRPGTAPLRTDELKSVIRQAQDLGVSTINLVGGEPLLRPDVTDLIASVDKDLSQVILFTNGTHLAERARELRQAGLTSVIVALDAARPEEHDRRKGQSQAFARAVAGIAAARKQKLLVGISTVVQPDDVASCEMEAVFALGKQLGVNQVLVLDAVARDGRALWTAPQLQALVERCADYQRRKDYPGIHAYAYSKSARGIGCAGGVSHFYVSPHGEVCPCDFDPCSVGNVRNNPLHVLWDRFGERGQACSSLDGCRRQATEQPALPLTALRRRP